MNVSKVSIKLKSGSFITLENVDKVEVLKTIVKVTQSFINARPPHNNNKIVDRVRIKEVESVYKLQGRVTIAEWEKVYPEGSNNA